MASPFRVGQTVRVVDVLEGVVTQVIPGHAYIGRAWVSTSRGGRGSWTRTITILAEPEPKPDEPVLLGAVVRDVGGSVWVRERHVDSRYLWRKASAGTWRNWAHIDAVEVLFPGVPEDEKEDEKEEAL